MSCAAAGVMGRAHVTLLKLSCQLRRSCRGTPAAAAAAQYNVASVPPPRPAPLLPSPAQLSAHKSFPGAARPGGCRSLPTGRRAAAARCRTLRPHRRSRSRLVRRRSCWRCGALGRDIPGARSVEQSECEASGVRSVCCCQPSPRVRPRTLVTVDCVKL